MARSVVMRSKGRRSSALALLGSVLCAHPSGTSAIALVPRLPAFLANLLCPILIPSLFLFTLTIKSVLVHVSVVIVSNMFRLASICPSYCAPTDTSCSHRSCALCARIVGICRNTCANGSTAIAFFLLAFLTVSSTARFISISGHPPPR